MGVYIKGMEMPPSCGNCYMFSFLSDSCRITNHVTDEMNDKMFDRRFDDCPLIPVHEPHGRLGDLDELYNHLNEWYLTHEHGFSETEKIYVRAMLSGVKDTPTVIPASEGGGLSDE